ncbi:MAG: ABC transporter permease subunit [Steroidobacteraceae bacterium]
MSGAATPPPASTPWQQARAQLYQRPLAVAALVVLLVVILVALLGPLFSSYNFATPSWNEIYQTPSLRHWLGTDALGRDQLVRVLRGCRISLLVGVAASLVSVAIGVLWGATAGYAGGKTDSMMMRFVDILYTVPFIPLVIVMTVLFGRNFLLVFVAIGVVSWLDIARIVRGQTLSLKQREFIEAARALGVRTPTMIMRHLVPNLIGVVIIYATLTVPTVILFEAFLSFLGLGVHAPLASLGSLVSDGADHLQSQPYLLTAPAILLAVIIACFSYLGDGLRDALDPRARH